MTDPTEPIERDQAYYEQRHQGFVDAIADTPNRIPPAPGSDYYEQRAARAVQVARDTLALDPGMAALAGFTLHVEADSAHLVMQCLGCDTWQWATPVGAERAGVPLSLLDLIGAAAAHAAELDAHPLSGGKVVRGG